MLEHELYLPSVSQLNDPADGRPKLAPMSADKMCDFLYQATRNPAFTCAAQIKQVMTLHYNVLHHGPEALQRIMSQMLNEHLKDYRVYSLSRRYDNLNLWAKYAAGHSGYCLEFTNEGPLFEHAIEVIYGNTIPMDVTNPNHRTGYFFYCKRQEWSNEEEIRLVLPRGKGSKVKIDPRWLTRLIVGEQMSDANQRLISEWAEQRKPKLTILKAYFDEFHQELRLRD